MSKNATTIFQRGDGKRTGVAFVSVDTDINKAVKKIVERAENCAL
jgi:hypothetical protein